MSKSNINSRYEILYSGSTVSFILSGATKKTRDGIERQEVLADFTNFLFTCAERDLIQFDISNEKYWQNFNLTDISFAAQQVEDKSYRIMVQLSPELEDLWTEMYDYNKIEIGGIPNVDGFVEEVMDSYRDTAIEKQWASFSLSEIAFNQWSGDTILVRMSYNFDMSSAVNVSTVDTFEAKIELNHLIEDWQGAKKYIYANIIALDMARQLE